MTVLDTGVVVEYLFDGPRAPHVESLFDAQGELAAPDVLVFEIVAVLRRLTLRGEVGHAFACEVLDELVDVPLALFESMPLRTRCWEMRENVSAADGLFLALAEQLEEPLLTTDAALVRGAAAASNADVVLL